MLAGNTDIEDSLVKLDNLTQEEARMAAAELLKTTRSVDDRVKGVEGKVKDVRSDVHDVRSDVHDVRSDMHDVGNKVQGVDDKLDQVNRSSFL